MNIRIHKNAFTLAEVLITLTIIGVIAALTIPNLIKNQQDHADVQRVKKVYSTLSNAYQMAVREYGTIPDGGWTQNQGAPSGNEQASHDILEKILAFYKNSQICELKKCYIDRYWNFEKTSQTVVYTTDPISILNDGTVLQLRLWNNDCKLFGYYCGWIRFDINGKKGPNRSGYDIFTTYFIADRLIPAGNGYNGMPFYPQFMDYCRNLNPVTYGDNGLGCTAWILYKGNMDYKYKDIEW